MSNHDKDSEVNLLSYFIWGKMCFPSAIVKAETACISFVYDFYFPFCMGEKESSHSVLCHVSFEEVVWVSV